jgi:hypothetical protein
MKKLLLSSLLLLSLLPVSAQRLTVEKTTVECGKVAYNSPVTATYEMRNKGFRRLHIYKVETDCGCTSVKYPEGDISAGERFKMLVTYDSRQLGHFHHVIAVKSSGTKKPLLLHMKGIVVSDLLGSPDVYPFTLGDILSDKNDLEFDDVNKGDTPKLTFHIFNNSSHAMQPNLLHLPPYLTAIVTPERLAPNHAGEVQVMLNSAKLHDYGLTQTSIYMGEKLGDKVSDNKEITVSTVLLPSFGGVTAATAQYEPKMVISSSKLSLPFGNKKKNSGEIEISNQGRTALKITSLQMFTTGLRVTLGKTELQPGESTKLKVTAFRDLLKTARSKPRVLMITNDPKKAKVVVEITN